MEFLTSLTIICLSALLLGALCAKVKLPSLLGMLVVGIVLGPYVLNLISPSILNISADLRQLALIIILTRAGLNLNLQDLRKNGISVILLCFVPASVEILAYTLLDALLLKMTVMEGAILGCVMAAVSPAVVVPRMLKLKESNYGTDKGIPDMIMSGASADDTVDICRNIAVCISGGRSGHLLCTQQQFGNNRRYSFGFALPYIGRFCQRVAV